MFCGHLIFHKVQLLPLKLKMKMCKIVKYEALCTFPAQGLLKGQ